MWADVQEHPGAFARRTLQQLRNTIVAPFNWGEPILQQGDAVELDALRELIKQRIGVGVNVREFESYRQSGLLDRASHNSRAVSALAYQMVTTGIGSLLLLISISGMLVFSLSRQWEKHRPLWILCAATGFYKIAQDVFLGYQINYLNNVYLVFVPFVLLCAEKLWRKPVTNY